MDNNEEPAGKPAPKGDAPHTHIIPYASLPETGFSRAVDGAVKRIGSWASWFWIVLMGVIVVNVFMKNVLGRGSVQFEEIQWHIYAALFLVGLSYAMVFDDHVRVDLLHENFRLRTRAWIELLGALVFLIPFLLLLLYFSWPFVVKAFVDGERSSSPAGLSNYWIIKSFLLIGIGLLLLTTLARTHRCIAYLFLGARPAQNTPEH